MPVQIQGTVDLDAHVAPGRVKMHQDLSFMVNPFSYEIEGNRNHYAGVLGQAVTDNSTNYVYLDNTGTLQVNTTGFSEGPLIRLARVITLDGLIRDIIDERVFLTGAMGLELTFEQSAGESSTTETTYQQKLRLTTPDLPEGDYLIEWYCEINHSNAAQGEYVDVRIELNDSSELGYSAWPFPAWDEFSGMAFAEGISGVKTFDLDFRVQNGGTAYIRRARLLFRRIR
jgi:hypothetical protein